MNKSRIILIILCLTLPFQVCGLSLKQAQEMMLYKNLDIVIANQDYCKKMFEESEAKSVWYPSLDVVGNYNYFSEKNSVHFGPLNTTIGTNYRAEAGLDLSFPITTAFVNMYNVRYRHLALIMKEAQNTGLKNQLSFRLGAIYFLWSLSFGQVEVYETLVQQLTEQATQAKNRKAGGIASTSMVLDAQSRLASAVADLVTAQNESDSLKHEIMNFIQCPESELVPETYSFVMDSAELNALDTFSLNNTRPELAAMDLGVSQLLVLQDIIRGQKYPNLVAVVGYRYANPGLNMGDSSFMGYAQAGLQLKWNLFDGFKTSNQRKQTAQQIEMTRYQKQQMIDGWNNAIKNAKLQVMRAGRQQEAAHAALVAADALVTDAKNGVSAGVATQTEYLNALTARARAALSVRQAEFAKNMAILQLYFASGRELKF